MHTNKSVVLITGTSTGFGRLTAEFLSTRGYKVFATMRGVDGKNATAAKAMLESAARSSADLHVLEMDVTQDSSVARCVQQTIEQAGRIDVLVNNAGFASLGLMESFTMEQAQRIFNTNVFGVLRTIRAVLPQMHKQGAGLLLQVSSGAGRIVLPSMGLYCATKFAVEAITETYRYELAGVGIDSVSIQPGAYPTAIFGNVESGADTGREAAYTDAKEIPLKVGNALASSTADPMEIAEGILQIIETPAGTRKLRYRIGKGASGVEVMNETAIPLQSQLLSAFGLAELTAFRVSG